MLLQHKIALITGASTGVGFGIAKALYEQGARVIMTSRNLDEIQAAATAIDSSGTQVIGKVVDVKNHESVMQLLHDIEKDYGALHLLVNNAGITGPHQTNITDYPIQDWQNIIQTNISGTFYTLKYALPLIEQSGGGSVVNLSAVNGLVGIEGIAPYTASKHAVIGLTQSAALEYAQKNIRVNAVAPGYIATQKIQSLPDEVQQWMAQQHPMKRMATMEEVAHTVVFLLSPLSSFTTGAVYAIDGGYLAR